MVPAGLSPEGQQRHELRVTRVSHDALHGAGRAAVRCHGCCHNTTWQTYNMCCGESRAPVHVHVDLERTQCGCRRRSLLPGGEALWTVQFILDTYTEPAHVPG